MGPLVHTAVSLSIGTAAWVGGASPLAVPVAVAAGVLPDLDHVLDFCRVIGAGRYGPLTQRLSELHGEWVRSNGEPLPD